MKLQLTLVALAFGLTASYAQSGVIDQATLDEIKQAYTHDATTKAIGNAIQSNSDLKALALDQEVLNSVDHTFKYKAKRNTTISNQYGSGRCWMFTSMNVLRPSVVEKFNLSEFDFSHNYTYFWDIFEKSNLFLSRIIDTADAPMDDREVYQYFRSPVGDGGVWNHFYNLVHKYGVVPQEAMPETVHSNGTSSMMNIIRERLRKGGMDIRDAAAAKGTDEELLAIKIATLKDVYRTMALCLGEPPVEFDWKYTDKDGNVKVVEGYTPQAFFADIEPANFALDNYIMIMNDPTRPYYSIYDIKNYRNTDEGTNWIYLNLPIEDIKAAALKSIKAGESLYISCDVGKESETRSKGVMAVGMHDMESLLGIDLSMDKRQRILSRHSGSSHAMTLTACDTDSNDTPIKWEVENSWGAAAGNKGYVSFTDEWFESYLFRIVIKKEYLDKKAIKALGGKSTELPVWDYMY